MFDFFKTKFAANLNSASQSVGIKFWRTISILSIVAAFESEKIFYGIETKKRAFGSPR